MADRAKACRVLCVTSLLPCCELCVCTVVCPPSLLGRLFRSASLSTYLYTYSCRIHTPPTWASVPALGR